MCLAPGLLGPILFKALSFVLCCRVFFGIPIVARSSIVAALCIFGLFATGNDCSGAQALGWTAVASAIAQGVFVAIVVSGVFFAIDLFCAWFFALMLPSAHRVSLTSVKSLQVAFFLIFLVLSAQVASTQYSDVVVRLFASTPELAGSGLRMVIGVGTEAFKLALLLAAPYIAAVFFLDISLFVVARFLRVAVRPAIQAEIRFPVMLLLLSLLLYTHSESIAGHLENFLAYQMVANTP